MIWRILIAAIILLMNMLFANAQPILEFVGGDTYDWKRVSSFEEPLMADIQIRNAGDEKLIISEVKPECGCTLADVEQRELEPGEIATMPVILHISGYNGRVYKGIVIKSNDPVNKEKLFHLAADIYKPIEIIPGLLLTFGDMKVGKESSTMFMLINNTQTPVIFYGFTTFPSDLVSIDADSDVVISPGEEFEIIIKATPVIIGDFNCSVDLKTNNDYYPEINIKCVGKVKE